MLDDPTVGFSLMGQLASIIELGMNPACASNVISLLCNSWFRECVNVKEKSSGENLWLSSLLCRDVCNTHWEMWTACLKDLELDPSAKSNFDNQMLSLVGRSVFLMLLLFSCFFIVISVHR
jgi:hypothetical protein